MQLTVQTLLPPTNEELNAFAWVCLSVCLTVSKYQLNNDVIITSFCFVNKSCCQTTWSTVYFATSWSACACCKSNSAVACMQLTVQTLLPPTNEEANAFARVCLSVCCLSVSKITQKTHAWIWMKCCVSTDVGTWTNWLTFEPDPDYRPDAGTGLLSPLSYQRCYA